MSEHVIYRHEPDISPEYQFYSIDNSIYGGGPTLAKARRRFRDALELTDGGRDAVEYYETPIADGVSARWVLDDAQDDRAAGARRIADLLRKEPQFMDAFPLTAETGDAVFIISYIDDTARQVFDQMSAGDSVYAVIQIVSPGMPGVGTPIEFRWIAFTGNATGEHPSRLFDDAELDTSLGELAKRTEDTPRTHLFNGEMPLRPTMVPVMARSF